MTREPDERSTNISSPRPCCRKHWLRVRLVPYPTLAPLRVVRTVGELEPCKPTDEEPR